jgi:hypothetical protein
LYVTAKAHHLVADGVFETQYHADGDNHHSQSYRHTNGSDTNSRTAHLVAVSLREIDALGYE